MKNRKNKILGYTVVEMMVTIVVVSVLAATVGVFFSKLLTMQENEREEAYIREKLADICGAYADDLSVGAAFSKSNQTEIITYRHETGGVSLETGRVSRVAYLSSSVNATNNTLDLNIDVFEQCELIRKMTQQLNGNAPLIPLLGDMVRLRITPLNGNVWEDGLVQTSDAALGYLEAMARYRVKNDDGEFVTNTVTAGRVVRLWNRE